MKVAQLVGITVAVWGLAALAAVAWDGPSHWLPSIVAAALCLAPAVVTMLAVRWTEGRPPVESIGIVLIAPLFRLVTVLGVGLILWRLVPALREAPVRFGAWILLFYLLTLVTETALLLARPAGQRQVASGA